MGNIQIPRPTSSFPANVSYASPYNRPREYFVIDLETAGLSPLDPITEIAAVRVFDKSITGQYTSLVKGVRPQTKRVAEITGITDDMLSDAPPLGIVATELGAFLGKKAVPLFAHNARFDAGFLFSWGVADRIEANCPICDSVQLAKTAFPALPGYSLDYLAEELFLKRFSAHRALGDTYCTAQLVDACYNKIESERGFITGRTEQGRLPGMFDNPPCPFCGSVLVRKDGKLPKSGTQRYSCKLCNRKFTNNPMPNRSRDVKRGMTLKEARSLSEDGKLRCLQCKSERLVQKEHAGKRHTFVCKECRKSVAYWDDDPESPHQSQTA